ALFKNMFSKEESFIILDDCLVNLDPSRKEKAIELIQRFSEKYQVIFSTCNPETAKNLGGNIINI
ncbi:MAG: ATP-binding protein, partial [Bacillota bacterium]